MVWVFLVELPDKTCLDRLGVERRTVVEGDVRANMEDVGQAVGRDVPTLGERGLDLDRAGLETGQALGQVIRDRNRIAVAIGTRDGGIELNRRLGDGDDERLPIVL